jgi:hypothetical protein
MDATGVYRDDHNKDRWRRLGASEELIDSVSDEVEDWARGVHDDDLVTYIKSNEPHGHKTHVPPQATLPASDAKVEAAKSEGAVG